MKNVLAAVLAATVFLTALPFHLSTVFAEPLSSATPKAKTNVSAQPAKAAAMVEADNYYKINSNDADVPSWQKYALEETTTPGTYTLINKDFDETPALTDTSSWYSFTLTANAAGTAWSLSTTNADKSTFKTSMVVPGSVDGKPVTEIKGDTFRNKNYKYMTVSENIASIGNNAFRETSLIGIKLPKSLQSIGIMSFYRNLSLTNVNLEDTSLTSTGNGSFRDCPFTEITLPPTLKTLGSATFSNCQKLKTVTFLGSLERCNRTGSGDNDTWAFNNTIVLENIYFKGYTAPGYNTETGITTAENLIGFQAASLAYQLNVHYPKGGLGYDTEEFYAGFREGTTFAETPKAEAFLEGKPNIGAQLIGSFAFIDAVTQEEGSIGYWERCDTPYFAAGDAIEKISGDISLQAGQYTTYAIKAEDSKKYIRFCVKIPLLDMNMTENARLYASAPTRMVDEFKVTLSANGSVAGNEFYIDEEQGIGSYGAAATVVNSTNSDKDFYLVSAWYDRSGETLLEHSVDKITVPAGSKSDTGINEQLWTGQTKSPADSEELKNRTLKIFAFEDLPSVKPLAKAEAYSGLYDKMTEVLNSNPTGLYSKEQIDFVRKKIAAGEEPWASAFNKLISDADAWIDEEPSPVAHWYVPGYYTNASGHQQNRKVMLDDLKSAYACGLAYQFTGKTKYADQTIRILNAWARTTRTIGSEDSGLVASYVGNGFPMAAAFVKDYKGWDPADKGYFDSWLKNVFRGFFGGNPVSNNAGDWRIFARMAIDAYLGDISNIQNDAERMKNRIADNISENGELPHENARGNAGIWYTYFALAPMTAIAQIIYNTTGEDLFNYTAPNGRNLKMALDKHLTYCKDKSLWPYGGGYIGGNSSTSWNYMLYEATAGIYNDKLYLDYVKEQRPINGPRVDNDDYHHMAWFYPTLMYGSLQLNGGLPE